MNIIWNILYKCCIFLIMIKVIINIMLILIGIEFVVIVCMCRSYILKNKMGWKLKNIDDFF